MKVYIVYNSNANGKKLIGIYETYEKAHQAIVNIDYPWYDIYYIEEKEVK